MKIKDISKMEPISKKLWLLIAMLWVSLSSSAYDFEVDGIYYNIVSAVDKTVEVTYSVYTKGLDYDGDIDIPDNIIYKESNYSVIGIGKDAFCNSKALISVHLPSTITYMGNCAFEGCNNLTSINMPKSITSIGSFAFDCCYSLLSIEIPSEITFIGNQTFYNCRSLTTIDIPAGVTFIGKSAFEGCSGLTAIVIPDAVTSIEEYAFAGCKGLSSIRISDAVTSIEEHAFAGCKGLSSIRIPNAVTSIGDYAFSGCTGVNSVTLGSSIASLGWGAFENCTNLVSITIPESLTSIGNSPFSWCTSLQEINVEEGNTMYTSLDGVLFSKDLKELKSFAIGKVGKYVIPSSVTNIRCGAFEGCKNLTSIEIPNSVQVIADDAFRGCSGLTSVILPPSLSRLGNYAFTNCTELRKSAYPNTLTTSSSCFPSGCRAISYPVEGALIESGFIYNSNKTALYFVPLELKGDYKVSESVSSIGMNAFYNCTDIRSIIFPDSLSSIGDGAFIGCHGLTSVILPSSIKTIGQYIFSGCTGLKKCSYPNTISNPFPEEVCSVAYPPEYAIIDNGFVYGREKSIIYFAPHDFKGELIVQEPMKKIESKAFIMCSGLTSVICESSNPPLMADDAFEGLYEQALLSVPENAVNNYLATSWSLFKNIRQGNSDIELKTYSDGVLNYRLLSSSESSINNLAIVIPDDYSSLTEVTIPQRFTIEDESGQASRYYVDAIGYNAFKDCKRLTSVSFHSRSELKIIGEYAFAGTGITSINVPETVEFIGNYAFRGCSSLSSIVIPKGVTSISEGAFMNVTALSSVSLNEGLKTIGENAFNGSGFESIFLPSTIVSIGADAFNVLKLCNVNISNLNAWCNIDFGNAKANPLYYGSLYLNGNEITDLIIPEDVMEIKDYAFYNGNFSSVTFTDRLRTIGSHAFDGKNAFPGLIIPGSVISIGEKAFSSTALNLIFAYSASPIEIANDAFTLPSSISCDRVLKGMNFGSTSLKSLTIGNNVTEIQASKFKGATALTELKLGNNLKTIGDNAFSGCTALTEVILPPSVEIIGTSAFDGNSSLSSIKMGHSVKSIGEKAFNGCPATEVKITAQTPPTAANNTFSNYTGTLSVQGEETVDAYYDAYYCWDRFDAITMTAPTGIEMEKKNITGKPGDTFQLSAKLMPENVTLPHIFWRSTNPAVATVDHNGLVTLHQEVSDVKALAANAEESGPCKIIAESLYANGPVGEVLVNAESSAIEDIINDADQSGDIDYSAPYEVYNLQGVRVGTTTDGLITGIYIICQGNIVKKVALR